VTSSGGKFVSVGFIVVQGEKDLARVEAQEELRRVGAVDRDHEERGSYSWIGISGVREKEAEDLATGVAIGREAKSRRLRG
jgi:hypothetical protein